VWSACCIFFGALLLLASTSPDGATLFRVAAATCGIASAVYGFTRARKLGVEAENDGVALIGYVRVRRVAWSEIDKFVMIESWPYAPILLFRDGSRMKTLGLGASGIRHRASLRASHKLVDDLNNLVEESR
jgi:hypothetical protein